MADISRIVLPTGTTYDLKDATAREMIEALSGYVYYAGVTTTTLEDGSTTNPIGINGELVTATTGMIVTYYRKEFVWNGSAWQEFGDLSALGDLAYQDDASATYTPAGTVSAPVVSVELESETKYVAESATGGGSVTAGTAAACTLPTLATSVSNETLTLTWTDGSFTANTPTAVTLPRFVEQTIATDVDTATATQPIFTGTPATITVS